MIFLKKVLTLVLLLLFLTSCQSGQKLACYQIFDSLSLGEIHVEIYPYRTDLSNNTFFARLYSSLEQSELPNAFAYCDDYYVALSSGLELWEIHIFHPVSSYHINAVTDMLAARRDRLQKEINTTLYSETTRDRIMQASVFSCGQYVILSITDHNDRIQAEISEIIQ